MTPGAAAGSRCRRAWLSATCLVSELPLAHTPVAPLQGPGLAADIPTPVGLPNL